jgi:hypothetical protein
MSDAPKADPSVAYQILHRESAALLGINPVGDLTALQAMQIDLVAILRMEIDAAQGAQLAGKEIDIGRLSVCVSMLGKLLPQRALEAEASQQGVADDARERLAHLIDSQAAAVAHEHARESEIEAEVAADFYRDAMRPPAPARIGPPSPARVEYIDGACLDDRDEPSTSAHVPPAVGVAATPSKRTGEAAGASGAASPSPPAPSSDREWLSWYRSGAGDTGRGIHSIPKDF